MFHLASYEWRENKIVELIRDFDATPEEAYETVYGEGCKLEPASRWHYLKRAKKFNRW